MQHKFTRTTLQVLFLLPLAMMLLLSFARSWMWPNLFPDAFSAQVWVSAYRPDALGKPLLLTLGMATTVAALGVIIAFISSYLLHQSKYRYLLTWIALIPFCTAPVIVAANLQFFFAALKWSASFFGVTLAQLFIAVPYAFILFTTFWNAERRAQDDAARTLGASRDAVLWRVHWPAARPLVTIAAVQLFLFSWFEYGLTLFIGVGKVKTLAVQVLRYTFEGDLNWAAVAACCMIIPPAIALFVLRKTKLNHGT